MPNPDSTLLSWITAEVNQALSVVREQIAKFSSRAGDTALLHGCSDHLHQVSGALRMVGLNGATRFCEAIEAGFAGLTSATASSQTMGLIDKAVLALKEFVEGLERGQPNLPLRLYPVYRELGALHGRPDSAERDLFYPDLAQPAAEHPEPATLAKEDLPAYLQAQRAQFQRGLLAWLRQQPGGLQHMTQAVDGLHRIDRKSTRLNSSHLVISYAVFCLKKKSNGAPWSHACVRAPRCAGRRSPQNRRMRR